MKEVLLRSAISLIEIIIYPVLELNQEIDAIILNRHRTVSTIKIFLILLISSLTIHYSINNPKANNFFLQIAEMLNVGGQFQFLLSYSLIVIACCNFTTYTVNILNNTFCRYYFGGYENYLKFTDLTKMKRKIKEKHDIKCKIVNLLELLDACAGNSNVKVNIDYEIKPGFCLNLKDLKKLESQVKEKCGFKIEKEHLLEIISDYIEDLLKKNILKFISKEAILRKIVELLAQQYNLQKIQLYNERSLDSPLYILNSKIFISDARSLSDPRFISSGNIEESIDVSYKLNCATSSSCRLRAKI